MRVFHDTRELAYRAPYGAVALGGAVDLAVDVAEAEGAAVQLRTWVEGAGERLYEMEPAGDGAPEGGAVRYQVHYVPEQAGIVWYQFIVTDAEGYVWRYGARNGRVGGEGQLVGWEPPSFRLSVYDPEGAAPVWHGPIADVLQDEAARSDVRELVATLLENYPAPLCRTAAPWEGDAAAETPAPELSDMLAALEGARHADAFCWFAVEPDVFGFWRRGDDGHLTCALFNASPHVTHDVFVPLVDEEVTELVAGYAVPVVEAAEADAPEAEATAGRYARVFLWQFGSAILHFHPSVRLAQPMEAGLGVLAHITSLPTGDGGLGTLGAPARAFVDWLAQTGVRYWQVLPANPTDEFGSPYAGISAFAGNALLLERDGASASELVSAHAADYRAFCEREADWLESYACFSAIRRKVGAGKPWQAWPKKYRAFKPQLLDESALAEGIEQARREQFAFDWEWRTLRSYANERGLQIIGDMPIYVSADSADVWAHPELFQLGADGMPAVVAGCPPDAFAAEGQVWGNPVYDWDALRAEGYAWWLRRLQRAFDLYDYVRLDHFIGFSRYFSIPAGAKALEGAYRLGPGFELFELARRKLGPLPVIAEDLGLLTPRVRALVDACGFPGMDIIQFVDGGDPLAGYEPRPGKIAYTGTHDNQTLLGYVRSRYPEQDEAAATARLFRMVVESAAPVRIVPLQDVLGLGDEARMNVPGVAKGNWAWQARAGALDAVDVF